MNSLLLTIKEYYNKGLAKYKRIVNKTEEPVLNVFQAKHTKHALLSYITAPFKLGVSYRHNNTQDVQEIAMVLDSLGYTVDVMDYRDKQAQKYSYEKYQLILGFGEPFCASYPTNANAIRIFYGTTMSAQEHNKRTIARLQAFHKKHHLWLTESARIEEKIFSMQLQAVDAIVMYGNKLVQDSYKYAFSGPLYQLHNINFILRPPSVVLKVAKNWDQARNEFCLFPAAGMIHKGVDVILELFAKHPEWELHLGAPITREPRFMAFYKDYLNLPNIHFYGFVDMTKPEYWNILDACGFFLSPSASEGCPTSVINACTNGKLIPIATPESGLEPSIFNIPIEEITEASLEKAIKNAQALSNEELEKRALLAHEYYSTVHSKENYVRELRSALTQILEKSAG